MRRLLHSGPGVIWVIVGAGRWEAPGKYPENPGRCVGLDPKILMTHSSRGARLHVEVIAPSMEFHCFLVEKRFGGALRHNAKEKTTEGWRTTVGLYIRLRVAGAPRKQDSPFRSFAPLNGSDPGI